MNHWCEQFIEEAKCRFHLDHMAEAVADKSLMSVACRYTEFFIAADEVREQFSDTETLLKETAAHCYHGGIIVNLYRLTEEDYEIGEKTLAVLTNMDTVFFSGLMFSRWNVKKRCVSYKTDLVAESLLKLLRQLAPPEALEIGSEDFLKGMTLIFAAGAVADIETMHDPYIDLKGIE